MNADVKPRPTGRPLARRAADSLSIYLPIFLMGVLALGTYWLARNTPGLEPAEAARAASHDPDYFMRRFSVKTFDAGGRLRSEVYGSEARHFPDTDTVEIDEPRIRSFNERGELTVATARRALTTSDGSQVQLLGDAVVTRDAVRRSDGSSRPRMVFRGEFLHAFLDTEQLKSHKPVSLTRGNDSFTADTLDYNNLDRVIELKGRVHGNLTARQAR